MKWVALVIIAANVLALGFYIVTFALAETAPKDPVTASTGEAVGGVEMATEDLS